MRSRRILQLLRFLLRVWLLKLEYALARRTFAERLMEAIQKPADVSGDGMATAGEVTARPPEPAKPTKLVVLVRHGQTTYNVEGRLPGQLAGVTLTDEGRRQAHRAAVALSGMPVSAVIASPLERAQETAETIARGWALPVRLDERLLDTDVGHWAGQKIEDVAKADPSWRQFVEHPTQPPDGVESLSAVQHRAVAAVEEARHDPAAGHYLVFVAHADVIKLILAHYTGISTEHVRFMAIGNASISALAFAEEGPPTLLAINWTPAPGWLTPPLQPPAQATQPAQPQVAAAEAATGGLAAEEAGTATTATSTSEPA